MEMENLYVAPEVEVLEVEVEKGFGDSLTGDNNYGVDLGGGGKIDPDF